MLICFDYDGVIVDSFDALLDIAREAWRRVGSGREPVAEDFSTIERLDFDAFAERVEIAPERVGEYIRTVVALQAEPARWQVQPFAGIPEVLQTLAREHTLAVVTASSAAAVRLTLGEHGLDSTVTSVLGAELKRPKHERIVLAMREADASVADTWMVGDAISDIREGKLAGVRTAAVTWGYQSEDLLRAETPDAVVEEPAGLLALPRPPVR